LFIGTEVRNLYTGHLLNQIRHFREVVPVVHVGLRIKTQRKKTKMKEKTKKGGKSARRA
jgi:hypothetical protein